MSEPESPADDEPQIGGQSLDAAEAKVLAGAVRLARQGSVPAMNLATQTLQRLRGAEAARIHGLKMDPDQTLEERAYYLGRIGVLKAELLGLLGFPTPDPGEAPSDVTTIARESRAHLALAGWRRGKQDRRLEIRAVELVRTLAGGDVEDWQRG